MKKAVIVGSFSNPSAILAVRDVLRKHGYDAYPDEEHFKQLDELVKNSNSKEYAVKRLQLMQKFLKKLQEADLVYVFNQKDGKEYIGVGASFDIGYSLALNKKIVFHQPPSDPNMYSIYLMLNAGKKESTEGVR